MRTILPALPAQKVLFVLLTWSLAAVVPGSAWGQFDLLSGKPLGGVSAAALTPFHVQAELRPAGERRAELRITTTIDPGWHIYSITQGEGGPQTTLLALEQSADYRPLGPPTADPEPRRERDPLFNNLLVESHEGKVTWRGVLELSPSARLENLTVRGSVAAQACATQCIPRRKVEFTARLAGARSAAPAKGSPTSAGGAATLWSAHPGAGAAAAMPPAESFAAGPYRAPSSHAKVAARFASAVAAPGESTRLIVTIEPDSGWHAYALAARDPQHISKPTLIVLTETSGLTATPPVASRAAEQLKEPDGNTVGFYTSPIDFEIELRVPQDAWPGRYPVAGLIGYQTCEGETRCDRPLGAAFRGELIVASDRQSVAAAPIRFAASRYRDAAALAAGADPSARTVSPYKAMMPSMDAGGFDLKRIVVADSQTAPRSALWYLLLGFLGGVVLNLMPCVLPVLGLKILAFVEQADRDRSQIFLLNVWYSAGILAVFMVLATLPIVWQATLGQTFTWGQQFGNDGFTIILTSIVFTMALSLIGVWEVPIPGFASSSQASKLAAREGAAGAFAKGAITTVLATPCGAPFMGAALGWAFRQPPLTIYALFAAIGLGMASPYLIVGLYPRLIHFLPKPGAWMETFKQAMGFLLLGTVVYLLTFIHWTLVVPAIAFLIGLWVACWWIGRVPFTAPPAARRYAYLAATVCTAACGWFCFAWLHGEMSRRFENTIVREIANRGKAGGAPAEVAVGTHELPWQPYTLGALGSLTRSGRTVMVDFTADWCPNCKFLEKFVLNTPDVKKVVEKNGVVPLVADYTDTPPEIAEMLAALDAPLIPVLAIFPAKDPYRPIVLKDGYARQRLIDELNRAGPSRPEGQVGQLPYDEGARR